MLSLRFTHPICPLLLGERGPGAEVHLSSEEDLIVFAAGFGGQKWGYLRGEQERIACIMPWAGRSLEALSFEQVLREQILSDHCATPAFLERVRAMLHEKEVGSIAGAGAGRWTAYSKEVEGKEVEGGPDAMGTYQRAMSTRKAEVPFIP